MAKFGQDMVDSISNHDSVYTRNIYIPKPSATKNLRHMYQDHQLPFPRTSPPLPALGPNQPISDIATIAGRASQAIAQIVHVHTSAVVGSETFPQVAILLHQPQDTRSARRAAHAEHAVLDHLQDAAGGVRSAVADAVVALHDSVVLNAIVRADDMDVAGGFLHDHGEDDALIDKAIGHAGNGLDCRLYRGDVSRVVVVLQRSHVELPQCGE